MWPAAVTAVALAVLALATGGHIALPQRAASQAAVPAPASAVRETEVVVSAGPAVCRWQPPVSAAVQIADCGDERSSVRVVFEQGRVTQYRLNVIQSSSGAPAPSGVAPHIASGAPSYSISGPPEETKITPQSPLIRALNSSTAPAYVPAG